MESSRSLFVHPRQLHKEKKIYRIADLVQTRKNGEKTHLKLTNCNSWPQFSNPNAAESNELPIAL